MESTEVILSRINQTLQALVSSHTELKSDIKPIIEDVQRMKLHLYTDNYTGSAGIIKVVAEHGSRIEAIESTQESSKKIMATWGIIGGGILTAVIKLVTWLFIK